MNLINGAIGSRRAYMIKGKLEHVNLKVKGSGQLGLADFETEPRGDEPMPAPLKRAAPKSSNRKLA
jgi:hypothetical protein